MLEESFLNLQITILLILGTLIFIFVSFKRRDLIAYLPAYILMPPGYLFVYLQIYSSSFRLLGNFLFLIGVLAFISAIYYEYFNTVKKVHRTTPKNQKSSLFLVSLSPFTSIIIGIQIIFSILILIAIVMLIKLFLMKRNTKHATLLVFLTSALITSVSTILSFFPLPGMWEFSFVAMIILSTLYLMFPILIFLEEKLAKSKIEVKESEEKFKKITEESHVAFIILQDNVVKYANQKLAELSGYSLEEVLSWKPGEFLVKAIAPDSVPLVMEQTGKKQKGDPDIMIQYPVHLKKKSGELYWADDISTTIMYEGRPADLISLIDITDKLKAEQELKESEGKFKALFKGSPVPTLTWQKVDKDFQLIDYNKALQEYSQDDIKNYLNINASEFFLNRPDILKDLHRCFNEKINITREIKYHVNILEEERDLSTKLAYIPPDLVLLHVDDITERIESVEKLKESEEQFRTITEQSFMGIIIIQDGNIKYVNGVLSRIMGYSLQEIRKWSSEDFFKTIHPEDLTIAMKKFQRMQTGRMGTHGSDIYRILTKSGTIKWIDINSKVIQYQGKSAILVTLVDVTTKKEAERLIIEENKKLVELDSLRKELITRISHELRTPLTSMYAASQILLRSNKEDPLEKVLPYIEISHHGSIRLKELIENLLDSSRIENKKFELKYSNENINAIINDCVNELNYLADIRQITINVNLTTEVYFKLDKYRFPQVIINILSNALKNTPPKGMVFINFNERNEFIDIIIKDTGVGLTQEEKGKLFQKFGKIERYGMDLDVDIEGAGLGLYISKEIVELHGGQILVESEGRHKGSTFIIRLNKGVEKFQ